MFLLKFAYLDPNTGSIIIQFMVGLIAGIALFGRRAFSIVGSKIKNFFKNNKKQKQLSAKREQV